VLKQAEALLERESGNNNFQHFRGMALTEQGRTLAKLPDRRPQTEDCYSQAILIWDNLQQRNPRYAIYREWQAIAYQARGQFRTSGNTMGSAEEDLDKARLSLERMVKESPDLPGYRYQLGQTYQSLGRLALKRGSPERAVAWLTKACDALRVAHERSPENALFRRFLEEATADLARARADPGA
jgi:tetratricopeptide (TPR) repeat protein